MSKKPYKVRAKNYDPKLAIEGSSKDVIKVSMSNPDKPKEKRTKKKNEEKGK